MERIMELADAAVYYEERSVKKSKKAKWLRGQGAAKDICEKAETSAEMDRRLAEWLRELAGRRDRDRWIPCSERLPEEDGTYYTAEHAGDRKQQYFHADMYGHYWDGGVGKVIAWRPQPEKYKG